MKMMLVVVGYVVFALVGVAVFIYTRDLDDELMDEEPVENVIGDAYRYRFVDSDYARVERELILFADEIAYGF
jgi:hypothetical protein